MSAKKFLKSLSLLMILSLFFTSCGYTLEDRFNMAKYKRIGRSNAIQYIEEKYGFKPKVKEVENTFPDYYTVPDFWPTPDEDVIVTMEYEGKEFSVKITGDEKSLEGADDYQKEELIDSLTAYIKSNYPSVKEVVFPSFDEEFCYFSPKFEGENYNDLVTNNIYSDVILKICEPDVNDFPIEKLKSELDFDSISIINYNDSQKMPFPDTKYFISIGLASNDMYEFLPYISQCLLYQKSNGEDSEPELTTVYTTYYDSFVICSTSNEPIIIEPNTEPPTYDMDAANETLISSYRLWSNQNDFLIYVPLQETDKGESIAVTSIDGSDESYDKNDEYIYFQAYTVKNPSANTADYEYSFLFNIVSRAAEE